jgi:thioesterase domain-containing protein
MLVPIQTSGKNPPLFMVHGTHGVMPLGRYLGKALGSEQPFYVINANGVDGKQAIIDNLRDMVRTYVSEIDSVRATGPLIIAGTCAGTLAAIEIVRELQAKGRKVAPVILVDPPVTPRGPDKKGQAIDPRQPQIAAQLYEDVRSHLLDYGSRPYNELPFDHCDSNQIHLATLAGVGSVIALSRHVLEPFSGQAELILSARRAPFFFDPKSRWRGLLPGWQPAHVLPRGHAGLFRVGRDEFARVLKFVLEGMPNSDATAENETVERRMIGADAP